jgi:hypothetical protein
MKKKLLLLSALLIFACSYGQTYEDIISIDSKEQFIRIGIENDYEVVTKNDNSITLGVEPNKDKNGEDVARGFATYDVTEYFTAVGFQFLRKNIFEKTKYDDIFSFVKKNLKFKEVVSDASFYTIDDKRSIGFTLDKDWCYVLFWNYYE